MDTFTELRQLADDLTELGDTATAVLVRQAIDRFSAWKFEAGEGVACASPGRTTQARGRARTGRPGRGVCLAAPVALTSIRAHWPSADKWGLKRQAELEATAPLDSAVASCGKYRPKEADECQSSALLTSERATFST